MFITIALHITRYGMQDINTLKKGIKHYSFSYSMVKGHETEANGTQFLLHNRKHFIFMVQKKGNGAE